jgi:hypothetical protein
LWINPAPLFTNITTNKGKIVAPTKSNLIGLASKKWCLGKDFTKIIPHSSKITKYRYGDFKGQSQNQSISKRLNKTCPQMRGI